MIICKRKKMETKDAETQVNLETQYYTLIIDDLKSRNKILEELHYNTRFNSGKIHDEINSINEKDELISLRNEFKNMIKIKKNTTEKNRCCCCIIS